MSVWSAASTFPSSYHQSGTFQMEMSGQSNRNRASRLVTATRVSPAQTVNASWLVLRTRSADLTRRNAPTAFALTRNWVPINALLPDAPDQTVLLNRRVHGTCYQTVRQSFWLT